MNRKRFSSLGVVALLVLSVLLGAGIAAAAEEEEEAVKGNAGANEALNAPITVVYSGNGFALKGAGEEFHMLRMHIVRVREIDPVMVRGIMEGDKSIEEIKEELIDKGGAPFYYGSVQFSEDHYRLANVTVTQEGDTLNLTLRINADVMLLPLQGAEPLQIQSESVGSVGNISVTVKEYEGVRIGEGKLTMYGEEYRVLLGLLPPLSAKK
jgi:hypothetical protein